MPIWRKFEDHIVSINLFTHWSENTENLKESFWQRLAKRILLITESELYYELCYELSICFSETYVNQIWFYLAFSNWISRNPSLIITTLFLNTLFKWKLIYYEANIVLKYSVLMKLIAILTVRSKMEKF